MCSLSTKLFLGVLLAFLCSNLYEKGKKNFRTFHFLNASLEMLREGRKEGKKEGHDGQREGQELNNRMCSHTLDLETTTQTFMLHARPIPLCPWHL
jgi:hypothetical protein